MALTKVTYVENQTVIHAQNLNDIQDNIILNGTNIATHASMLSSHQSQIANLEASVKSTAQAKAEYHLGFFRDAQGYLCEV